MSSGKYVKIIVELRIIHNEEKVHSLSQDMAGLLEKDSKEKDTIAKCEMEMAAKNCGKLSYITAKNPKKLKVTFIQVK